MKYLILVRHGADNDDGDLSDNGIEDIARLSSSLRSIIAAGSEVKIKTSRIHRAKQSAQLIMGDLNIYAELQIHPILSEEITRPLLADCLNRFTKFVEEESVGVDVLILVTHLPQIRLFSPYYGKEVLGIEGFTNEGVSQGMALVIDCQAKTIITIP